MTLKLDEDEPQKFQYYQVGAKAIFIFSGHFLKAVLVSNLRPVPRFLSPSYVTSIQLELHSQVTLSPSTQVSRRKSCLRKR